MQRSESSLRTVNDDPALHSYAFDLAESTQRTKQLRRCLILAEMWLPRKAAFDRLVNAIAYAYMYTVEDMPKAGEHRKKAQNEVKKCLMELGYNPDKKQINKMTDHIIENWL